MDATVKQEDPVDEFGNKLLLGGFGGSELIIIV